MISRRILRIKILQSLYSHFLTGRSSFESEKEALYSLERSYDLFIFALQLLVDLKDLYVNQLEMVKNKHIPDENDIPMNTRFIENCIITDLAQHPDLLSYQSKKPLNWATHPEVVKQLYKKLIIDETFLKYLEDTPSLKNDKSIIKHIITNILTEVDVFYSSLEEDSIFWATETNFILSAILKLVDSWKKEDMIKQPLFKEEIRKEETDFVKTLLRETIQKEQEHQKYIQEQTHNWDVERIAFMDVIIMQMALTELQEFTTIPRKVIFNEYIDLAKDFSTPSSGQFVNGILDKIATRLEKENKIRKI